MKLFVALFVTPIVIALLMAGPPLLFGGYLLAWEEFILFAVPAYFVALIGLIIFGLPIVSLLRKRNALTLLNLSVAGAIAGVVMFNIFMWLLSLTLGSSVVVDMRSIVWGLVFGCITALTFGAIAGITSHSSAPLRGRTR